MSPPSSTSTQLEGIARDIFARAEASTLPFPAALGLLAQNGFNGYLVDFQSGVRICHHAKGQAFSVPGPVYPPARTFHPEVLKASIREAQQGVPGYTYQGFCRTVTQRGGTAGYFVSIPGGRVLYYGVDGETHTERFPCVEPETD